MSAQQEMTLEEYVGVLPESHLARKEFEALKKDRDKLSALEGFGVDNWDGYSDAMRYFETGELP